MKHINLQTQTMRPAWWVLIFWLVLSLSVLQPLGAQTMDTPTGFAQTSIAQGLSSEESSERNQALDALIAAQGKEADAVLMALDNALLYVQNAAEPRLAIANAQGELVDVNHASIIGTSSDATWSKIRVNNAMRIKLRPRIGLIKLRASDASSDAKTRLAAAEDLASARLTLADIEQIKALLPTLDDDKTRDKLRQIIAGFALSDPDPTLRLAAIADVADMLDADIRARLSELSQNDADAAVRLAATKTLAHIQQQVSAWEFAQNLVFGVSLGSVLLLSAIGLAITFGVMGVINMAHGEMMMIGAYVTWLLQIIMPEHVTAALFLALPAAFLAAGLVGIAIERGLIRFLYGRPLETLLATFGVSLILQQAARMIFTPLNRAVELPEFMQGSWVLNPVFSMTYNRIYILVFALLVFFALLLLLKRSTFGLRIRAVAQNRQMARACGVRSGWVDALTFGLGSGIAGVAGVALALMTNVGPNLGQNYIVDAFMVVVLGGVGNLWGTLVASMGIGILNKFLEPYAGAVLAKVVVLVLVILVIQKRPRGLFPQKGRAAEE